MIDIHTAGTIPSTEMSARGDVPVWTAYDEIGVCEELSKGHMVVGLVPEGVLCKVVCVSPHVRRLLDFTTVV